LEGGYTLCPFATSSKREEHAYTFPASTTFFFSEKKMMKVAQQPAIPEDRNSNPGGPFPFAVPKKTLACKQCLTGKKFSAKQEVSPGQNRINSA